MEKKCQRDLYKNPPNISKELMPIFKKEFIEELKKSVNINKITDSVKIAKSIDLHQIIEDLMMFDVHARSIIIDGVSDHNDGIFMDVSDNVFDNVSEIIKKLGKVIGAVQQIRRYIYDENTDLFEGDEFDQEIYDKYFKTPVD
jgi:hypothetical protein